MVHSDAGLLDDMGTTFPNDQKVKTRLPNKASSMLNPVGHRAYFAAPTQWWHGRAGASTSLGVAVEKVRLACTAEQPLSPRTSLEGYVYTCWRYLWQDNTRFFQPAVYHPSHDSAGAAASRSRRQAACCAGCNQYQTSMLQRAKLTVS